ncbi:MAG: hypothetical protein ABIQ32_03885 [Sphingomicrobium sp.]
MITIEECLHHFDEELAAASHAFRIFEEVLPSPTPTKTPQGWLLRYADPMIEQAMLMKLARLISITSAIRHLVAAGQFHEQGILQRVADETNDDIVFLAFGKQNGLIAIHRQYLKRFWREEFDGGATPSTYQPRSMVRRSEIHAYLSKQSPAGQVRSAKGVDRMIYGVYSGFVHGASTHIFDLIDPETHRYRLSGAEGNEDTDDYRMDSLNYPVRTLMCAVVVARTLGEGELADGLVKRVDAFLKWLAQLRD